MENLLKKKQDRIQDRIQDRANEISDKKIKFKKKINFYTILFKKKISNKIEKWGIASAVKHSLGLQRISRKNRCCISFKNFFILKKKWGENTINILNNMEHGVVVLLCNNDYFDNKDSKCPIIKQLFNRIGSNENLSSVIYISKRTNGTCDSGCPDKEDKYYQELVKELKIIAKEKNWEPTDKKKGAKNQSTKDKSSNELWKGHYCIDTSGGTHKPIREGVCQIVNDGREYADEKTINNIEYKLCYLMLCCKNPHKLLISEDEKLAKLLKRYLRILCNINNIDLNRHNNLDINGNLICGLSEEPIFAEYFQENHESDSIELCHDISRKNFNWKYDEQREIIISNHNENNIFFGKHWINAIQGEVSGDDFIKKLGKVWINAMKKKKDKNKCIKMLKQVLKELEEESEEESEEEYEEESEEESESIDLGLTKKKETYQSLSKG